MRFSVVVCGKNEEKKISQCLNSILNNNPDEIIYIDGNSSDKSAKLAKKFTNKIYIRKNSNLTKDRQFGIDKCRNELIAMIDCDHILKKNDINNLIADLHKYNFDMIQAQLKIYNKNSFMSLAENQSYEITHNIPGKKRMIGVAPAILKKKIFLTERFDDYITKTIDDTDFIYRLRKRNINFGVGTVKIFQNHNTSFLEYIRKFLWYGKGDGEFIQKNPSQLFSILFHLFIRYNLIYSYKSLLKLKFLAISFFFIQSVSRFCGIIKHFINLSWKLKI
jgi:glycosyltransferase involved in cell wall biosynthesis